MKFILNKQKFIQVIASIFLFFIFLNDNTVYSVYFNQVGGIFLTIAIVCLVIMIVSVKKIYFGNKFIIFMFSWLIFILIVCLISGINRITLVRLCYWLLTFFFVCVLYSARIDIKKCLGSVCKIYCIWSLSCYLYTVLDLNFLPLTNTSNLLMFNHFKVNLHGYVISNPITHLHIGPFSFLRLDRPFGEPGIAQMYSNLGLIICLFEEDNLIFKKNRKWILLFFITTILEFSLTGYLILLSVILVYLLYKKKYQISIIFVGIAVIVAITMTIQKISTESYSDRAQDYKFMFNTIINNLPFGIGIGNAQNYRNKGEVLLEGRGFYCGLLYPLAEFGIIGLFYYYVLIKGIYYFSKNKYFNIAFGCFIILTLFSEPQTNEPFILCLLFNGLINSMIIKSKINLDNDE